MLGWPLIIEHAFTSEIVPVHDSRGASCRQYALEIVGYKLANVSIEIIPKSFLHNCGQHQWLSDQEPHSPLHESEQCRSR